MNKSQRLSPTFMDLLPARLREQLVQVAHISRYSDGQLIHSRGEIKPGLSIVRSGAASVGVYGADGKFVMVTVLTPGESFGEFTVLTELPRTHDVAAVGATEIYQIPVKKFLPIYDQHHDVAKALLKATLWRTHMLLETVDGMRRLSTLERTAKLLLSMLRVSDQTTLVNCRQSELAFTLGVSRVSVGKALKELAALNLIQLGYRKIILLNPDDLEHWVNQRCETIPIDRIDQ